MAKIESYTYSAKKDGLFKTKFFENSVGRYDSEKEIDFNSRFKNTKIKYNFDKDPAKEGFEIAIQGKKFTTSKLAGFHSYENYGHVFSFTDKQSKELFFFKDGNLSGPYQGLLNIDENLQMLVIENGELAYLDKDLNKTPLNCSYVNDHAVMNKEGKYACLVDGKIVTDFCFDSPNIEIADKWRYKPNETFSFILDKNAKKAYFTKNKKVVQTIENFEGQDTNVAQTDHGLYIATSKDKTCVFDIKNGEVLLDYTGKAKILNEDYLTVVSGENKSFAITSKQTADKYAYKFDHNVGEIPYHVTMLKNSCVQVMDDSKKCAIASVDENAKSTLLTKFIYDSVNKSNSDNYSQIFMPIVIDKKMGAFNTETKQVEVTPFCENIIFDEDRKSEVKPGFYRFYFEQDKRCGVVNNHDNIEIEPVLRDRNTHYPKFHEFSYDYKPVYINLAKPTLFAEKGEIKHSSTITTSKDVTETKPKYDEGEALTGAAIAGGLLGGLAAAYVYHEMSEATVSQTKTVQSSETQYHNANVDLPEGLDKSIHMQSTESDKPEAVSGKLLSVKEYLSSLELANSQNMQ